MWASIFTPARSLAARRSGLQPVCVDSVFRPSVEHVDQRLVCLTAVVRSRLL